MLHRAIQVAALLVQARAAMSTHTTRPGDTGRCRDRATKPVVAADLHAASASLSWPNTPIRPDSGQTRRRIAPYGTGAKQNVAIAIAHSVPSPSLGRRVNTDHTAQLIPHRPSRPTASRLRTNPECTRTCG